MLNSYWSDILSKIDYAFQPIVNSFSGNIYAVEALVRNTDSVGFLSISDFFNTAYSDGVLFDVEHELRYKVICKFKQIHNWENIKLFYNYDHRIMEMENYRTSFMEEILEDFSIPFSSFCLELSEKNPHDFLSSYNKVFERVRNAGFQFAIDDFGVGFSNFEMLYHSEPDYIKLDQFMIRDIDKDLKKRTLCEYIVRLSKLLGVTVIAEGIETKKEYSICRILGCDLIQGYFIGRPTLTVTDIHLNYPHILHLSQNDRRQHDRKDELIIRNEMHYMDILSISSSMQDVLDKFRKMEKETYFPVLDASQVPMGIIHERDLKKYIYSPFGKDLLCNRSVNTSITNFITKCPVIDIKMPVEQILEIYTQNMQSEGIILIESMKYIGFLTVNSILQIINEKNLAMARDLNPLTKLPGNIVINEYITGIIENKDNYNYLIYFDFDNFKPFNDKFGFRQGDRVIQIFADLLRKYFKPKHYFIGHIGGDDFFTALRTDDIEIDFVLEDIKSIVSKFKESVYPLYEKEDLSNNYYLSKDRSGTMTQFPLLDISTAMVEIPCCCEQIDETKLTKLLAKLKHDAKASDSKIAVSSI